MAEAFFSINNNGEVMSAAYYTIDDELLQQNLLDEYLLHHILERAKNPDKWEWSFEHHNIRIDILSRNEWKVEFFVSRQVPLQVAARNLMVSIDRVTFH